MSSENHDKMTPVASPTGGKDVITVMRAIWVKPGKSGKQGYLDNMGSK